MLVIQNQGHTIQTWVTYNVISLVITHNYVIQGSIWVTIARVWQGVRQKTASVDLA